MNHRKRTRKRERYHLNPQIRHTLESAQKNEITEYYIYRKLADTIGQPVNQKVLQKIADEELSHYHFWKEYTQKEIEPARIKIWFYFLLARFLGITFAVKLMEKGEENAQQIYQKVSISIPEAKKVLVQEENHEKQILSLINEELLTYVSSIVLGLNDALVELTGALAGFTFALQNAKIITVAGFITGVSAAFSMATSEYLSTKSEKTDRHPLKAAVYTGVAYLLVVLLLISPYLFITNIYLALIAALILALLVILWFTFYISVATEVSFIRRFSEMAALSLGVASISFLIGYVIRSTIGIEI